MFVEAAVMLSQGHAPRLAHCLDGQYCKYDFKRIKFSKMALQKFDNILPSLCAKFTLRSKQLRDFDGYSWTCDFVYITRLTDQAVSACLCQVGTFFHHPLPMSIATEYRMH